MSDPFERAVERETSERRQRGYRAVWKRLVIHVRIYLIVNLALAGLWAIEAFLDSGEPLWFLRVARGWGIGLFIHYVIVTQVTGQWWPRRRVGQESGVTSSESQQ